MSKSDNIWDTFGRWDELSQLEDVEDVKAAISGKGWFVPNYVSSGVKYAFDYATHEVVNSTVPTLPSVVDFGCGLGRNGPMLREHFPRVLGFDLPEMADRLRKEARGVAENVYGAIYTAADELVQRESFCTLYDSVALQHIVSFEFHNEFIGLLEKNHKFRTIVSLHFRAEESRPAHLHVLEERGWQLWHNELDTLSFRGVPHCVAVYRRW